MLASVAVSPPSGGWCAVLGKAPGSIVTDQDVSKIILYVFDWMTHNGYGDPTGSIPAPWNAAIYLQMKNTLQGGLAPIVGRLTCDQLPANLEDLPSVKAATPPKDAGEVFQLVMDWTGLGALLGDLLPRLAFLVGIIVLLLIGIRRVLS